EVQPKSVDHRESWSDRALLSSQQKITKNLIEVRHVDLAALRCLEIHKQIASDQVGVCTTHQVRCLSEGGIQQQHLVVQQIIKGDDCQQTDQVLNVFGACLLEARFQSPCAINRIELCQPYCVSREFSLHSGSRCLHLQKRIHGNLGIHEQGAGALC